MRGANMMGLFCLGLCCASITLMGLFLWYLLLVAQVLGKLQMAYQD